MKIRAVIIFMFLILISGTEVMAKDISAQITEAEDSIRKASTIDVNYSKKLNIDSQLIDYAAKQALSKKNEYENSELPKYKALSTDIVVNLQNAGKKFVLNLDGSLSSYAKYIDNIIINADGLYFYVKPKEFSVQDSSSDVISLQIKDTDNVVAKYNGKAAINRLRVILIAVFALSALYIVLFLRLFVAKKNFNEEYNKKKIYIIGYCLAAVCIVALVVVVLWDGSSFAVRSNIEVKDNDISFFEVDIPDASYQNSINGVFMGVPLYSDSFSSDRTTVCLKSKDSMQGDKIISSNYVNSYNIMKFKISESGEYYLRNNTVEFTDIRENNKGLYEAVSPLAAQNIISGKAEGIFGLNDTLTRAETVTMLCKMLSIDSSSFDSETFDDVKSEDWYYKYVMVGKEYGILSGYDDNTFRAGNTISRQEFAAVLGQIMTNQLGYVVPESTEILASYSDSSSISPWAAGYAALLERENIKIWQDAYEPNKAITRGEAAMLIYRVYCIMS